MSVVEFSCDLQGRSTPLKHVWEHTVGSCHAPLALRADWQAQLRRCHDELGFRHVRFHGLSDDDMGTLVCQNDQLLYSFFNADRILDFLLSHRHAAVRRAELHARDAGLGRQDRLPLPRPTSRRRRTTAQWADADRQAGAATGWSATASTRCAQWYFEVWNEPNLTAFWTGKQEEYFELYRHDGRGDQERGRRAAGGRPGDGDERLAAGVPRLLRAATLAAPISSARTTIRPTPSARSARTP